jgi:single-strand DNA-binding protein
MNKVFLSGRITSDITRFGTDAKGGVSFTLVTSRPVIKDGQVQKGEDGYTGRAAERNRKVS